MPSKRKRSGPGFHRDDVSAAKRSKPVYNQVYRLPSRNIAGPGIFVTCVQGKERKAALQFIDLLNEVADRIYPGVVPQPLPDPAQGQNAGGSEQDAQRREEDDDMDALRNGDGVADTSPATSVPVPVQVQDAKEEVEEVKQETQAHAGKEEHVKEDDIAAQIASELAEIKSSERPTGPNGRSKAKSATGRSNTPVRFRNVETDTECLLFISVSSPLDPYLLVYTILSDVERTGEPRSRFVQRLTPVSTTCSANATDLSTLAQTLLPHFFPRSTEHAKTFKIEPRIRSHSKLKRADVIQAIASNIPTIPPTEEGGEPTRIHSANLTHPDLWIVVEVVKNSAAISVLAHYQRYRKWNLQSIAHATNEHLQPDAHGRIAQSLHPAPQKPDTISTTLDPTSNTDQIAHTPGPDQAPLSTPNPANPASPATGDAQQLANFRLF